MGRALPRERRRRRREVEGGGRRALESAPLKKRRTGPTRTPSSPEGKEGFLLEERVLLRRRLPVVKKTIDSRPFGRSVRRSGAMVNDGFVVEGKAASAKTDSCSET